MYKINLIIPSAGEASRLRPLSKNTSKVMVHIAGRPNLDYIIEEVSKKHIISNLIMVESPAQFDITKYLQNANYPFNVSVVKQPNAIGPADAIAYGMEKIDKELPVLVWLGDTVIKDFSSMLINQLNYLVVSSVKDPENFCIYDGKSFINKEQSINKVEDALVGIYYFTDGKKASESFEQFKGTDAEISDALESYVESDTWCEVPVERNKRWYDIGTLEGYHITNRAYTYNTSRAFNKLEYNDKLGTITKHCESYNQIMHEKLWYEYLTDEQKLFTPMLLPNKGQLIMRHESGFLLSDLLVNSDLPLSTMNYIIEKVFFVKNSYFNELSDNVDFNYQFKDLFKEMWEDKTNSRTFDIQSQFRVDTFEPVFLKWFKEAQMKAKPIKGMHGDLHAGNILFDVYTDRMIFIDPRGKYTSKDFDIFHVYGDNIYDWAKLAHDLYFGYSWLLQGKTIPTEIQEIFLEKLEKYNLDKDLILMGGAILLYTCIPLHYDKPEHQMAFSKTVKKFIESV